MSHHKPSIMHNLLTLSAIPLAISQVCAAVTPSRLGLCLGNTNPDSSSKSSATGLERSERRPSVDQKRTRRSFSFCCLLPGLEANLSRLKRICEKRNHGVEMIDRSICRFIFLDTFDDSYTAVPRKLPLSRPSLDGSSKWRKLMCGCQT